MKTKILVASISSAAIIAAALITGLLGNKDKRPDGSASEIRQQEQNTSGQGSPIINEVQGNITINNK